MVKGGCEIDVVVNFMNEGKDVKESESRPPAPMDRLKFRATPVQNMASAFFGGVVTGLTMTPLDVVKTRMQLQNGITKHLFLHRDGLKDHLCCVSKDGTWYHPTKITGTLDGMRKISQCEGLLSLWGGLCPTLLLTLPGTVLYFAAYEELKVFFYSATGLSPLWTPLVSAGIARFATTLFSSPIELIRTQMQASSMSYFEVHLALKSLLASEGYRGLWKGCCATLTRDTFFSAIYWFGFEAIKSIIGLDFSFIIVQNFVAGTTAGVVSSVITTPFDVAKTQLQVTDAEDVIKDAVKKPKQTMRSVLRQIYSTNGIRGLFAGLVPRALRVAPSCAIMIVTFEMAKTYFENFNEKVNAKLSEQSEPSE